MRKSIADAIEVLDTAIEMAEGSTEQINGAHNSVEELWVQIQKDTFTNWLNDKLTPFHIKVADIKHECSDGVVLCRLMEALTGKKIGRVVVKKNPNTYEKSGNLILALQTIQADGVKLVNIGASDISSGNLKLLLGLLWLLIRKYQIGSGKIPPKKLMLSWINAVLSPHMEVRNFTSDWNDGRALSGVIEYCEPGTFPDWHSKNYNDRFQCVSKAILAAESVLGIPQVISAENLSSDDLDELSGMTYLSYFMSEGSPGYKATLEWVQLQLECPVTNFSMDWNNGYVLSCLVTSLGGKIPGWHSTNNSHDWQTTCAAAMKISQDEFKVPPILTAKDMIKRDVDHIGVMAYAAWHRFAKPLPVYVQVTKPVVSEKVEVVDIPAPPPPPVMETPSRPPPPPAPTSPLLLDVHDTWPVGTTQTIRIDHGSCKHAVVRMTAVSPMSLNLPCHVYAIDDSLSFAEFTPNEKGMWQLLFAVGDDEQYSHNVNVFDPALGRVIRNYVGPVVVDEPYVFHVDVMETELSKIEVFCFDSSGGEVIAMVTSAGGDTTSQGRYDVTLRPEAVEMHHVHVYCGGAHIKESPFSIEVEQAVHAFVSGRGIVSAVVNCPAMFTLNAHGNVDAPLYISITGADGKTVPYSKSIDEEKIHVVYTPSQPGSHQIEMLFNNGPVDNSPFHVMVSSPSVNISEMPDEAALSETANVIQSPSSIEVVQAVRAFVSGRGIVSAVVNCPAMFTLNAHGKVDAPLYIVITGADGKTVPYSKSIDEGKIHVVYTPSQPGLHKIEMLFNNGPVDNSPFHVMVSSPSVNISEKPNEVTLSETANVIQSPSSIKVVQAVREFVSGRGIVSAVVNRPAKFMIDAHGNIEAPLYISITGADGNTVPYSKSIDEGKIHVVYTPSQLGLHKIEMLFNNGRVDNSPFHVMVSLPSVYIREMPDEVALSETANFILDASEQEKGTIEIDSDLQVTHCDKIGERIYRISFKALKEGKHSLIIQYAEQIVGGRPFEVMAHG